MADTRYWNKEFMIEFIEQYKSYPCLWKIKSKEYINKNLKNEAYEKLVALCKSVYPDANRDFVVKKIQSLRGSFRKEMRKLLDSKKLKLQLMMFMYPHYGILIFCCSRRIKNLPPPVSVILMKLQN